MNRKVIRFPVEMPGLCNLLKHPGTQYIFSGFGKTGKNPGFFHLLKKPGKISEKIAIKKVIV